MAVQKRTIREVIQVDSPQGWHWAVITEIPGLINPHTGQNMRHVHTIPPDAFEWRAAEYDLDADKDFETLLDIILHELHIPDPLDPRNHADDAAAAEGLTSPASETQWAHIRQGDPVPTHLYNAETVDKAREALLHRIAKVKSSTVEISSPTVSLSRGVPKPADPLDAMRNAKFVDADRVSEKRALVASVREAKLAGTRSMKRQSAMTSAAPRAASKPLPPSRQKPPTDDSLKRKGEA